MANILLCVEIVGACLCSVLLVIAAVCAIRFFWYAGSTEKARAKEVA